MSREAIEREEKNIFRRKRNQKIKKIAKNKKRKKSKVKFLTKF